MQELLGNYLEYITHFESCEKYKDDIKWFKIFCNYHINGNEFSDIVRDNNDWLMDITPFLMKSRVIQSRMNK